MRNRPHPHEHRFERYQQNPETFIKAKNRSIIASGIAMVIAGVLLILGRTGFIEKEVMSYIFSWQSLLIALGLIHIIKENKGWFFGIILILTGGFFLSADIFEITTETRNLFWPSILVIVGLLFIFKHSTGEKWMKKKIDTTETSDENMIKKEYIFGGGKNNVQSKEFKGGSISCILGGCEVNFIDAELAAGNNYLNIQAILGGVSLRVPRNWNVICEATGILGGTSDERKFFNTDEVDKEKSLIIRGITILAGIEIKNI